MVFAYYHGVHLNFHSPMTMHRIVTEIFLIKTNKVFFLSLRSITITWNGITNNE